MHTSRIAAVLAAAALVVSGSSLVTAPAQATPSRGIDLPAFYDPPTTIPSAPGTLIRSEPMPKALSLPIFFPGKATRLMYTTKDSNGQPVAVTGALVRSTNQWKGSGDRPVIAFAFGTIGQGDQCAPSFGLENPLIMGFGENGTLNASYEVIQMAGLLGKGYDIALTDYVGLGTSDRVHTYMNRLDQGHALLDVVRAVRNLPDSPITSNTKVGMWGYSQGGGAVAAAAELQPSYAPDVNLVGAYSGAPPANLREVIDGVDGNLIAGVLGFTLNGLVQSYPQLQPMVDARINEAGTKALKDISTMCLPDAIAKYGHSKSTDWITTGESLSDIVDAEPKIQAVVDAQRIGKLKPTAPVLVTTKLSDGTVPHKQARQLAVDWCKKGARVTYAPLGMPAWPGDTDRSAIHHIEGMFEGLSVATDWMQKRFEGKTSNNSCMWIGFMP